MSNKRDEIPGLGTGRILNLGYGNFVMADRIVTILESGSLPVRRLRERAGESDRLIDATAGRKMRSLVVTDSHHVILSATASHTLQERLLGNRLPLGAGDLEVGEGEFIS